MTTTPFKKMDPWSKIAFILTLGYAVEGKAFSYIGIPPAKLFIGDITLLAFLYFKGKDMCHQWFAALVKNIPFSGVAWCLLISLGYGIMEVVRGISTGYSPLIAFQNLVFNVYPLYIFLGIWVGRRYPDMMLKVVRIIAWVICFYGPAYLLFLHNLPIRMPGSEVSIFNQVGGSLVLVGLFCMERNLAKYWLPLTVSAFMMLAAQVRAEWLGFGLMLFIWGVLGKKMGKVLMTVAIVIVLLAIGFISDVTLPSTAERGGAVSSREIVARGLSAFDQSLAEEYSSVKNVRFYAGTIYWRTKWWHAIWDEINENTTNQLIGGGYGYPLSDLVPDLKGKDIRTPHNVFFFCLAYSGWIGVVLFCTLQLCIFHLLWRTFKRTRQPFGICLWAATVVGAFFGNVFETPFGAIPSYLMVGMLIAPGLAPNRTIRLLRYRKAETVPAGPVINTTLVTSPNA
jgi:hypothetical protein